MLTWLLIAAAGLLVAFLVWWLVFESEGVYLGQRAVIWLYDVYARRYDRIKAVDIVEDHLLLAQPIMARLPQPDPLVLDVATGTGRLPLALCHHARFEGHVIALDMSLGMLEVAACRLRDEHFQDMVTLGRADAGTLPFPDDSFDLVTCLEALEFTADPDATLAELIRVLRPGGQLLITNRCATRWMPGRVRGADHLQAQLLAHGMSDMLFEDWQVDYQKVWAIKAGQSDFVGARLPEDVLCCPACGDCALVAAEGQWTCQHCGQVWPLRSGAVLDLYESR